MKHRERQKRLLRARECVSMLAQHVLSAQQRPAATAACPAPPAVLFRPRVQRLRGPTRVAAGEQVAALLSETECAPLNLSLC